MSLTAKTPADQRNATRPPAAVSGPRAAAPAARGVLQRAQSDARTVTPAEWQRLQRQAGNRAVSRLAAPAAGAQRLPENLKTGLESLAPVSLDSVSVHYNSPQPARVRALAYAQGRDIHLAPGQEQQLPHEAWHLVQQAQGRVAPTLQLKSGVAVNDDADLEREADIMGRQALQRGSARPAAASASTRELQRVVAHASVGQMLAAPGPLQLRRDLTEDEYAGLDVAIKGDGAKPTYAESRGYYNAALAKGTPLMDQLDGLNAANRQAGQTSARQTQRDLKSRGYKHATGPAAGGGVAISSRRGPIAPADAPYRNAYQPEGGIFEAIHNKAPDDRDPRRFFKRGRANNSEIIFHQYRLAAESLGLELRGNLREIHRNGITNPYTNHTLLWSNGGGALNVEQHVVDAEDQRALLGTENGRSAAFIILQHGVDLGVTGLQDIFFTRLGEREGQMRLVLQMEPPEAAE